MSVDTVQWPIGRRWPAAWTWRRMRLAVAAALFICAVLLAMRVAAPRGWTTAPLTDIALLIAGGTAALLCLLTARALHGSERTAWLLLGLANAAWFCGHGTWSYYQLVLGAVPAFPHWMQILFVVHPLLLVAGLLHLPKPKGTTGLTPRHVGNIVLIGCTVALVFVVSLWEPALLPGRTWSANAVLLVTACALAAAAMTAVYLLWSYRWNQCYLPLLLIVIAALMQTITYVTNIHFRMTSTYSSYGWYNVSWLMGFAAMACAAHERLWHMTHHSQASSEAMAARERWLEACAPALLILLMLIVTWLNSQWLSTRVAAIAMGLAAAFALVLSSRDMWVQKEEQRLLDALNRSNDHLVTANRELIEGEQRFRALNAELERRVSARTTELQAAYRELEGFSYAVAHDIKAPLRAINSFGTLLTQEYADRLDARGLNYVQRMSTGALHVARLVDDLLAYAHVERLELRMQPTDLTRLIEACLEEQRDEISRLAVELQVEVTPLIIEVDSAAMLQALRNLVQNALKFSSKSTPPRIRIHAGRQGNSVQISVADNGIGFDMQFHDQIFALFQRLHRPNAYSGTGIGLAIARKAVERMGGRMWAQSKPDEGATFYIELPVPP